jgi:phosphatidate cytidylyltransferase
MNNLLVRALTGSVFVAVVIGALWLGNLSSLLVFGAFMMLGLVEFYKLFKNNASIQISWRLGLFSGTFLFGLIISMLYGWIPKIGLFLILPFLFILFLTELWRKKEYPISNIGVMILGLLYLVVPFVMVLDLNFNGKPEYPLAIAMFLLIWTNDTFAYLSGRMFGKTKLFERISPNKTWEGTIGGVVFTIGVSCLFPMWNPDIPLSFWIISALIIAPCAIFGDLLESLFKRSLNIKDSGNILPGHGGILDRFDAALFTIPFFYCWIMIYNYF